MMTVAVENLAPARSALESQLKELQAKLADARAKESVAANEVYRLGTAAQRTVEALEALKAVELGLNQDGK